MIQCGVYRTYDVYRVARICTVFRNDVHIRVIQIHITNVTINHNTRYDIFVEFENLSRDKTYIPKI